MKLKELLEKRAALTQEAEAICEAEATRDLTAEEEARFSAISAELKALDGKIARAQEVAGRVAQLAQPASRAAMASAPIGGTPVSPEAGAGPQPRTEFENLGEFFAAVASRRDDQRLATLYVDQSMGDGTTGGYLVPTRFAGGDPLQIGPQGSIFRRRGAMIIPADPSAPDAEVSFAALNQSTSNAAAPANVYGGVVVGESAEAVAALATTAKVRNVKMRPGEITGYMPASNKLLRNAPGSSAFLQRQLNGAMAAHEDRRCLLGTGAGQALGAVKSAACIAVNRATNNKFTYADASAMVSKLLMTGGTPFWSISQSVMTELLQMTDDSGRLVFQANGRDGMGATLLGYPIEWNERNSLLGSKHDVTLLNLAYYIIQDGFGPVVQVSEHVKFLEGQTVFKIIRSFDGQPWLDGPYTQEGGYQVSPFVTLDVAA